MSTSYSKSIYQCASVVRFGNGAPRDKKAQAQVSVNVVGDTMHASATVTIRVSGGTTTAAVLSMRAQDVRLLADALRAAADSIERVPPQR